MAFFEFFKKKNNPAEPETEQGFDQPANEPNIEQETKSPPLEENELEKLLRQASVDPEFVADFFKQLLTGEVVAIIVNPELGEGKFDIREQEMNLLMFEDGRVPVFTSTDRIFDKGYIKEKVQCININGAMLFKMTLGATFLLNPFSENGKEFKPQDIEDLLEWHNAN